MFRFRSLLLTLTVGLAASLSSCSSARYFDFTTVSSRQSAYHASVVKAAPAVVASPVAVATPAEAAITADPTLMASTAPVVEPLLTATRTNAVRPPAPAAVRLSEQLKAGRAERQLTRAQERRYERVLNRVARAEQRSAGNDDMLVIEIILCLLPPLTLLGVYLHEGAINTKFWLTLLGLIFFILPGVIYGLLVVTDTI